MTANNRQLIEITLTLGTDPLDYEFACQLKSWKLVNNTPDGEHVFTFCSDGDFYEDTTPEFSLELEFVADWRENGISDYLWANDGTTKAFVITHHDDIPAENVSWTGSVKIKAPDVGGEARTTEMTSVTLPCVGGKPTYDRV